MDNQNQGNNQVEQQPQEAGHWGEPVSWWSKYKKWVITAAGLSALILILVLTLLPKRGGEGPGPVNLSQPAEERTMESFQGRIYLWPDQGRFRVDEEFKIDILGNTGGANIVAVSVKMEYDPERLEIINIDGSQSVLTMSAIKKIEDNYVEIVRGQPGDSDWRDSDDGFTGEAGILASLRVKAKTAGEIELNFIEADTKMVLDDGKGTVMETEKTGGIYGIE